MTSLKNSYDLLTDQQKKVYSLGVASFDARIGFDQNPFGNGDMQSKCLWAAGWVDRSRGMV